MRKIFTAYLLISLFSFINASNYYLDKDATGANNGSSWTNAWTSFASISWASIGTGDTIFVSGGSTTKTYAAADGKGIRLNGVGVIGGVITITKGKEAGHNGEVIFSPTVSGFPNSALYLDNNTQNIVLDNLTFKWEVLAEGSAVLSFGNGTNNCTVKNSHIVSNGYAHGIGLNAVSQITISGNNIETLSNYYTPQQDGIIIGNGGGGHTIIGNSIVLRGTNTIPHKDIIQFHTNEGQHNFYVTTIANNFFSNRTSANGVYVNAVGSNRFEIYNNVSEMYNTVGGFSSCFSIAQSSPDTSYHISVRIYNNTAVTGGTKNIPIYVSKVDTLIMKNNIIMKDSGFYTVVKFGDGLSKIKYKEIDYNQYFGRGGTAIIDTCSDNHISFSTFRSLGYESHGENAEPTFLNKWNSSSPSDWKLASKNSPGVDEGTNISFFNSDKVGTSRPQGSAWDRGAFEMVSSDPDVIAPELLSAEVLDSVTIILTFSETLRNSSAQNKSNYSINNGIIVNSVSLSADGQKVALNTTQNIANTTYMVIVNNVKDLAGNIISPEHNSTQYKYVESYPADLVKYQLVQAIAKNWYQNYTPDKSIDDQGSSVPSSRWGGASPMPDTISYDLGSSKLISQTKISFFNWDAGRKYKFTILISEDGINWQAVVPEIWSDATEWNVENFTPIKARFFKLISLENNQSIYAGVWEFEVLGNNQTSDSGSETSSPISFELFQNYPNPFNPSTKIKVLLPQNTQMRLVVYNMLGELVNEVANGEYQAGVNEFKFDATGLASGVYVYRIESPDFVNTKKMILLR